MNKIADILDALRGALPLAERTLEDHRLERLRCGHSDIGGTDAEGRIVIGLWQTEIDQRDKARAALRQAATTARQQGDAS